MKTDTSGRAPARFAALALVLAALAQPGCDAIGPSLEDQRRLALARNRSLWESEKVQSYRYTFSSSCGECAGVDTRLGYPVSVAATITHDRRVLDDFWGTSVKDLVVLGRAP